MKALADPILTTIAIQSVGNVRISVIVSARRDFCQPSLLLRAEWSCQMFMFGIFLICVVSRFASIC